MRKFINICVFLLCAVGFAYPAFSQQQAGPVIDDIHRRNNPNHPGYVGNNAATPVAPREVWQSRYGALAADFEGGYAGTAEDENSARAARRVALQRCGVRSCKIYAAVGNGCIAAVHGGGVTGIGTGATLELAMQDARSKCPGGCEHRYAHCNNPVRIR